MTRLIFIGLVLFTWFAGTAAASDLCSGPKKSQNARCLASASGTSPSSTASSSENDARLNRLGEIAPDVKWGMQLRVNLDGDDKSDTVVLGTAKKEAVVAVILGAKPGESYVFRLPWKRDAQDGICAAPSKARIAAEKCPAKVEPPCRPASDRASEANQDLKAVRLYAGECDAFHFYFDGQTVRWWRG